jgi:hypothetical protein
MESTGNHRHPSMHFAHIIRALSCRPRHMFGTSECGGLRRYLRSFRYLVGDIHAFNIHSHYIASMSLSHPVLIGSFLFYPMDILPHCSWTSDLAGRMGSASGLDIRKKHSQMPWVMEQGS